MILIPICHSTTFKSNHLINQRVDRNPLLSIYQENISLDTTPPTISDPVDIIILVNATDHNITWFIADKNPRNYSIYHNYQQIESELNKTWLENQSIVFSLNHLMIGIHVFTITVDDSWNNSATNDVLVTVREAAYVPSFENPNDSPTNLPDPFTVFLIIIISLLIISTIFFRTKRKKQVFKSNLPPEDPLELETWENDF
jgi:hypothetical protein